jgi:hypothetical protein
MPPCRDLRRILRRQFRFFVNGLLFAPLAELFERELLLYALLITVGVIIEALAALAFHFYEIVLWHEKRSKLIDQNAKLDRSRFHFTFCNANLIFKLKLRSLREAKRRSNLFLSHFVMIIEKIATLPPVARNDKLVIC